MSLRNVLLAIGAVCVFAGIGLLISWFGQVRNPPAAVETAVESPVAILVAARAIPAGKSLEKDDFRPKNVGPGEVLPVNLRPGQETEYLGARSQRKFDEGEPLIASEFVKPETLAAKLKPGSRAVSIFVDAVQSASGLALPGDYVDVILTQTFDDKVTSYPGRKTVGETVLRDVRVIAIDQSMNPQPNISSAVLSVASTEARIPKMVTLELGERQAEVLLVAAQLGKFQLAVRPIAAAGAARPEDKRNSKPVWASDVSPALDEIAQPLRQVSIRVFSGMPGSVGYLCSRSACVPSDVNIAASETQTQAIPRRY
ncbi:MAG: Flp pilus assembly protein CpaB [Methylocella sp.]|jgi:pilus assembly protein CpaB